MAKKDSWALSFCQRRQIRSTQNVLDLAISSLIDLDLNTDRFQEFSTV